MLILFQGLQEFGDQFHQAYLACKAMDTSLLLELLALYSLVGIGTLMAMYQIFDKELYRGKNARAYFKSLLSARRPPVGPDVRPTSGCNDLDPSSNNRPRRKRKEKSKS